MSSGSRACGLERGAVGNVRLHGYTIAYITRKSKKMLSAHDGPSSQIYFMGLALI